MIETKREFYAYEKPDEKAEHYGPFATAEEAETVIWRLGWECVLVVRREVDEFGTVLGVQQRFYSPEAPVATEVTFEAAAVPTVPIKPLSEDEVRFFTEYERQMYSGKSKTGL